MTITTILLLLGYTYVYILTCAIHEVKDCLLNNDSDTLHNRVILPYSVYHSFRYNDYPHAQMDFSEIESAIFVYLL